MKSENTTIAFLSTCSETDDMIDLKLLPHRKDTNDTVPPIDRKIGYWKTDMYGNRTVFHASKNREDGFRQWIKREQTMYGGMTVSIYLKRVSTKNI